MEWNGKRSERYKSGVQKTKMQPITDRNDENAKVQLSETCARTYSLYEMLQRKP